MSSQVLRGRICFTFGYVLKAPRLTFPAEMVRVGSIYEETDTEEQEKQSQGHSTAPGIHSNMNPRSRLLRLAVC